MGFLDKLFGGNKDKAQDKASQDSAALAASGSSIQTTPQAGKPSGSAAAQAILAASKMSFQDKAAEKDNLPQLTDALAIASFTEYFAPNQSFFMEPGSPKYNAYFNAINKAKAEMVQDAKLFNMATKREAAEAIEHINNPKTVISNMIICGMIFRMGEYAVIKDAVYCVDFCEKTPNCTALYLLLTAQKEPEDNRRQIIDAGDRSDKTAFIEAMNSLKVLDPHWTFQIH